MSNPSGKERLVKSTTSQSNIKNSGTNLSTQANFADAKPAVDEVVAEFLREMVEGRLMDLEEGKTASQRSTTKELKDYGVLMVKDQSKMLDELKTLAKRKNVTIPSWLGPDKAKGLKALKEVHGKTFDKKFIKMMIIDHKKDVSKFERATRYTDADIQVFATKYLPVVQSHLDKIKALKNTD